MLFSALALALAASNDPSTLTVTVVSLDFSYPYLGEPGNTCQGGGSVYLRAMTEPNGARTPVVVRMADSAGLTPGSEAVLDVRRAGTGKDGTAVFCSSGRKTAQAPQPVAAAPEPTPAPPLVAAAPVSQCTARLFTVVKKAMGENKFGPSEFDPASALSEPEPVDCSVARSRVTNVLLLRMVKETHGTPTVVVGAEWGPGSAWKRETDEQRRVVKVYVDEAAL